MIWDTFEDRHIFSGRDPEHKAYRSFAHLASIIALLDPPPADLVTRGSLSAKFFFNGTFNTGTHLPPAGSLDATQTNLEGHGNELFMRLVRKMTPEDRSTAADLNRDPWIM